MVTLTIDVVMPRSKLRLLNATNAVQLLYIAHSFSIWFGSLGTEKQVLIDPVGIPVLHCLPSAMCMVHSVKTHNASIMRGTMLKSCETL